MSMGRRSISYLKIIAFFEKRKLPSVAPSGDATTAPTTPTSATSGAAPLRSLTSAADAPDASVRYLPYQSYEEAVLENPVYYAMDNHLATYCTICARTFKMSSRANLRYILRHEQSLKHTDKLHALLHGTTRDPSAVMKREVLESAYVMHVEQNPLFTVVDPETVYCRACAKSVKLDRVRSPRTVLLHCESQLHLSRVAAMRGSANSSVLASPPPSATRAETGAMPQDDDDENVAMAEADEESVGDDIDVDDEDGEVAAASALASLATSRATSPGQVPAAAAAAAARNKMALRFLLS
ncbi:hypothetical protein AMAG_08423 [Allomyces macrogynus ATCC 38327]|uniref:Uncharacterized protein n=1 Tax=Allomyces macrogynus (strain ATCC 38327) TaxID=578462 RepID=A0A0L0SL91_ALLM3|nr:hypothetical protein AMAG_08423 [Allomyces macrogynus ATCC 38327]|eukprot:KNE63282.1 hypothetical protein AMAG_08423 [Allomyces macrogynus ATCC 38327]